MGLIAINGGINPLTTDGTESGPGRISQVPAEKLYLVSIPDILFRRQRILEDPLWPRSGFWSGALSTERQDVMIALGIGELAAQISHQASAQSLGTIAKKSSRRPCDGYRIQRPNCRGKESLRRVW
jgi:hypothetical protein